MYAHSPSEAGAVPRIGIRCDAGPAIGVGHLVRCLALAEELLGRGARVELLGDLGDVAWARGLVHDVARTHGAAWSAGPAPATAAGLVALARRRCYDAVILDSYTLDPACAGLLRRAGITVLAVVDEDTRGQEADLFLDQNLGAEELHVPIPAGSVRLAGAPYVLLRDAVRAMRPLAPQGLRAPQPHRALQASQAPRAPHATRAPHAPWAPQGPFGQADGSGVPSVLCVFGGTDAAGVAPAVLGLAASTGAPFEATVVAARQATAETLAAIPLRPGQSVTAIPPTPGLPALAVASDLVLSAAGSSTWEMLCLGVPTALVWVADNQRRGYDVTVSRGLAAGLGGLGELRAATEPHGHDGAGGVTRSGGHHGDDGLTGGGHDGGGLTGGVGGGCVGDPAPVTVLRRLLTRPAARAELSARGHAVIDGRGRERVTDALMGRIADTAATLP